MAARVSNILPVNAYNTLRGAGVQLKVNLQGNNVQLAATGADYEFLKGIVLTLKRSDNQFTTLLAVPGLDQAAKDAEKLPLYDVVAEFTGIKEAITDVLTWMDDNAPTNVTTKVPSTWDDSTMIATSFSPSQMSGLRSQISAVIAEMF